MRPARGVAITASAISAVASEAARMGGASSLLDGRKMFSSTTTASSITDPDRQHEASM